MNHNEQDELEKTHRIVLALAERIKPTIEHPLDISPQELALNLQILLKGKGKLSAQDAESYRELIIGLNEKLKVLQISLERIDMLCKLNAELLREKEMREATEQDSLKEIDKIRKLQEQHYIGLEIAKNHAIEQLNLAEQQLKTSRSNEEELEFEVSKLKEQLNLQQQLLDTQRSVYDNLLLVKNSAVEEELSNLKESLKESLGRYDDLNNSIKEEFGKITKENEELENRLRSTQDSINSLKETENRIMGEKAALEALIASQQGVISGYKDLEASMELLKDINQDLQSQNDKFQSSLNEQAENTKELISELNSNKEKSDSQVQDLHNKMLHQDSALKSSQSLIDQLQTERSSTTSQNSLLSKKLLASNLSLKSLTDELLHLRETLSESQQKTESEMEFISNYTLKSSQDRLEQERHLKKFAEILGEKDSELGILREMIGELQKAKPNYTPAKDDPVDQALAEYLNQRPESMEINFVREDFGLYLFGSKRVFIKIENGKIISK